MNKLTLKSYDQLPIDRITELLEQAWASDYKNELRPKYDESYLRWISSGKHVSVLAELAGEVVGFALGLVRTVYLNHKLYDSYYTTLITVSPTHRRMGIASQVSKRLTEICQSGGYRPQMNVYHHGHAGLPTLKNITKKIQNQNRVFKELGTIPIWGKLLIDDINVDMVICGGKAVVVEDILEFELFDNSAPVQIRIEINKLSNLVGNTYEYTTGFQQSFRELYMRKGCRQAATNYYEFNHTRFCIIPYNVCEAIYGGSELKLLQIQAVFSKECSESELSTALSHTLETAIELGCDMATFYDQNVVPENILKDLGFSPSGDTFMLSVRGEKNMLDHLEYTSGPMFVDCI